MTSDANRVRALCLLSGGLDSQLALCLLRDQGVAVSAATFVHPLFDPCHARAASRRLNVPLQECDMTTLLIEALEGLSEEGCGDGAHCLFLHTEMLRSARQLMQAADCDFICTGDVLGQRFSWQTADGFARADRLAGASALVLRPLSACLLAPTRPERERWIQRGGLGSIRGAARKQQVEMAERCAITDYPAFATSSCPTDEMFAVRVLDLQENGALKNARAIQLLSLGRHFRLSSATKFILGRNEKENAAIEGGAELYDLLVKADNLRGPTGLLPFTATEEEVQIASSICLSYGNAEVGGAVSVRVRSARGTRRFDALPAPREEVGHYRIGKALPVHG